MSNSWQRSALRDLPGDPLFRGDERISPYTGDVGLKAEPDAVIRARDPKEISEILAYCNAHQIPVTFSGGRSGVTGASATEEGLLITTEQATRIFDIGCTADGNPYAIADPGIPLGELKEAVVGEGYFYPPDPTSYKEAFLGGTVATNATGEDSLLYGPTRKYIRELTIIKVDGTFLELSRPPEDRPPESKGTAGYIRYDPLIDLMIGSEGTLGYISKITLDLLPNPADYWAAIAFFPSISSAIHFVESALQSEKVSPRALEFMDAPCLSIWRKDPDIPKFPDQAKGAIYFKQEYRTSAEMDQGIENWLNLLNRILTEAGTPQFCDEIWTAQNEKEKLRFREWRHKIPATINERVNDYRSKGGGKVGSDWWVPVKNIDEAIRKTSEESKQAGLKPLIFGHLGNGHPHINYFAQNAEELRTGRELIRRQCQRAVQWGGGVAGEHGIGKIYRDLLKIQHPKSVIDEMIRVKRQWDPHWILGRGTLFEYSD